MLTIPPLDEKAQTQARHRQAHLTKPIGALGQLEALSIRLAGMTGGMNWLPIQRAVLICAGDHGITAQGVSAYPQIVTAQMVANFALGGAAVNVLARQLETRLVVLDAGVAHEVMPHPDLIIGKIALGTADFSQGLAMSHEQAQRAVNLGIAVLLDELARGLDIIAVGEMGIGNTTSASAIIAAITGKSPAEVTGRGTGINDEQLAHKIRLIEGALKLHAPASENTLAKIGGFEIGAMAGMMLAAASQRIPVVLDGLISTAGALIAHQLNPEVRHYLIAGHRSAERGHQIALDYLGLTPLLDLDLRLGEGSGAVLAFPIIEAAMRTLQEMATFDSAGVSHAE